MERTFARMSPREKIAQLVVPWIAGTYTGRRRSHLPEDRVLGRLAQGRRVDRVDRLAARHRGQTQHVAAARAGPAAHRFRPGGGYRPPSHRRHRVPEQYGHRCHRTGPGCLCHGAHHGARGPRRRHPLRARAGRRHQQQRGQPDHQHPVVRVRSPRRGKARLGGGPGPAGQRHARHGEALPGARRRRDRLSPGASPAQRRPGGGSTRSNSCRSGAPSPRT